MLEIFSNHRHRKSRVAVGAVAHTISEKGGGGGHRSNPQSFNAPQCTQSVDSKTCSPEVT